jgi:KRAB domain-containing zinc finger protein
MKIKEELESFVLSTDENQQVKKDEINRPNKTVKKDPELLSLHLSNKMPKPVKREVTRMEIKSHNTKQSKVTKYQCAICANYFSSRYKLKSHTERHYKPSSYQCKKCEKIFKMKPTFDRHKCGIEKCKFCEKSFSLGKYMSRHMMTCHKEKLNCNWLYCDYCGGHFNYKNYLAIHLKSQNCRKFFTCDICGKTFNEKYQMSVHAMSHVKHSVECRICFTKVKHSMVKYHMSIAHKIEEVACHICQKVFLNPQKLRLHAKYHQKTLKCHHCSKTFAHRCYLKKHLEFHKNPEMFKCKICGNFFKSAIYLHNHAKIHDENRIKKFECDLCEHKSFDKSGIKYHMKHHSKFNKKLRKNPYVKRCSKCSRTFLNEETFVKHLRKFHGIEREISAEYLQNPEIIKCNICDKVVKNRNLLLCHKKYHHPDHHFVRNKRYQCDLCEYRNDLKSFLRLHMEAHIKFNEKLKKNPNLRKCEKCKSVMINERNYKNHLINYHGKKC